MSQTYNLCFTWARSTTAVGLVPPSYYADKACDRARCYVYRVYNGHAGTETVFKGFKDKHKHRDLVKLDLHDDTKELMVYI